MSYKLCLFLHIYQPPTQVPEVTHRITEVSYLKITELLQKYRKAKLTLNMCASLTEKLIGSGRAIKEDWEKGRLLLENIENLVKKGQIELTGSAAYHPLLPSLPAREIVRQIHLNDLINHEFLGEAWHPKGFFPPEMAWNRKIGEIVNKLGYRWVVLDQIAKPERLLKAEDRNDQAKVIYKLAGTDLYIFFRQRSLSLRVAFAERMTVEEFTGLYRKYFQSPISNLQPPILAMDGETFGHHHPGQLKFLEELFSSGEFELLMVSELFDQNQKVVEIEPCDSAWGSQERWDNPDNLVHSLQWKLFYLALACVKKSMRKIHNAEPFFSVSNSETFERLEVSALGLKISENGGRELTEDQRKWLRMRLLLDRAVHSDQFWWASHNPCWHPEMVEKGARLLREVVVSAPMTSLSERKRAEDLYRRIVETGHKLYGDRIIGC